MTMSSVSIASATRRSRALTIFGVVGFAGAVAAASQVAIPIPGTPVPFTLQPMLVILAGMLLGPAAGVASMVLYLAAGAAGLPVFTPLGAPGLARFVGPTGGYLIAYPAAAWMAGSLSRRVSTLAGRWVAGVAGVAVIFLGGVAHLAMLNGSLVRGAELGITPFALLDVAKALAAAFIAAPRAVRRRV